MAYAPYTTARRSGLVPLICAASPDCCWRLHGDPGGGATTGRCSRGRAFAIIGAHPQVFSLPIMYARGMPADQAVVFFPMLDEMGFSPIC
jgi:hypothetical protein